jgi:hypothetical protein
MTPSHAHAVAAVFTIWSAMAAVAVAVVATIRRVARDRCPLCALGVPDHAPSEVHDLDA